MRFDSNRAWNEAVAMVRANREVLPVLAGVFFLLPALIVALFFGDQQQAIMAAMGHMDDPKVQAVVQAHLLSLAPAVGLATLVQLAGQMAVMAMLTDPRRPTVAEAIGAGLRALPVMVVALLLAGLGYLLATMVLGLTLALLASLGGATLLATLGSVLLVALVTVLACRLSMAMPVIVIERQRRPLAALRRAWAITRGQMGALLLFYLLLLVGYLVVAVAISSVLGGAVALVAGKGPAQMLVAQIAAGAIAAAASVVLTALLATIHRQLAD